MGPRRARHRPSRSTRPAPFSAPTGPKSRAYRLGGHCRNLSLMTVRRRSRPIIGDIDAKLFFIVCLPPRQSSAHLIRNQERLLIDKSIFSIPHLDGGNSEKASIRSPGDTNSRYVKFYFRSGLRQVYDNYHSPRVAQPLIVSWLNHHCCKHVLLPNLSIHSD